VSHVGDRKNAPKWILSSWRGLLLVVLSGWALLALSYVIVGHQAVARSAWRKALLDLAGSSVLVAISMPIAVSAWRRATSPPVIRYFIVLTVGVGSVIELLTSFFFGLLAEKATGMAIVALACIEVSVVFLWFLGSGTYLVITLGAAIRADHSRRSRSTPDAPST
jgi:hypothetical protein